MGTYCSFFVSSSWLIVSEAMLSVYRVTGLVVAVVLVVVMDACIVVAN